MTAERIGIILGLVIAGLAMWATWDQAHIARDTLRDSQRPFLYCREIKMVGGGTEEKPGNWFALATIKNSGPTQARRVQVTYGVDSVKPMPSPNWDPSANYNFAENSSSYLNVIPPGEMPGVGPLIDNDVVNGMKAAVDGLVFYGTIRYCDIFQIRHMTKFCMKLQTSVWDPKAGEWNFEFGSCTRHTCDDDECPDYDPKDNADCFVPTQ